MWVRVVCVSSAETDWMPKWALKRNGEGLLRHAAYILYFDTLRDIETYAREQGIDYVEWPDGTLKPSTQSYLGVD